jgi:hypothetical protein
MKFVSRKNELDEQAESLMTILQNSLYLNIAYGPSTKVNIASMMWCICDTTSTLVAMISKIACIALPRVPRSTGQASGNHFALSNAGPQCQQHSCLLTAEPSCCFYLQDHDPYSSSSGVPLPLIEHCFRGCSRVDHALPPHAKGALYLGNQCHRL